MHKKIIAIFSLSISLFLFLGITFGDYGVFGTKHVESYSCHCSGACNSDQGGDRCPSGMVTILNDRRRVSENGSYNCYYRDTQRPTIQINNVKARNERININQFNPIDDIEIVIQEEKYSGPRHTFVQETYIRKICIEVGKLTGPSRCIKGNFGFEKKIYFSELLSIMGVSDYRNMFEDGNNSIVVRARDSSFDKASGPSTFTDLHRKFTFNGILIDTNGPKLNIGNDKPYEMESSSENGELLGVSAESTRKNYTMNISLFPKNNYIKELEKPITGSTKDSNPSEICLSGDTPGEEGCPVSQGVTAGSLPGDSCNYVTTRSINVDEVHVTGPNNHLLCKTNGITPNIYTEKCGNDGSYCSVTSMYNNWDGTYYVSCKSINPNGTVQSDCTCNKTESAGGTCKISSYEGRYYDICTVYDRATGASIGVFNYDYDMSDLAGTYNIGDTYTATLEEAQKRLQIPEGYTIKERGVRSRECKESGIEQVSGEGLCDLRTPAPESYTTVIDYDINPNCYAGRNGRCDVDIDLSVEGYVVSHIAIHDFGTVTYPDGTTGNVNGVCGYRSGGISGIIHLDDTSNVYDFVSGTGKKIYYGASKHGNTLHLYGDASSRGSCGSATCGGCLDTALLEVTYTKI